MLITVLANLGAIAWIVGLGCIGIGLLIGARLPRLVAHYLREGKAPQHDVDVVEDEATAHEATEQECSSQTG